MYRLISLFDRMLSNGPRDKSSIPVIPKTQKMVLDAALRITQPLRYG